MKALQNKVIVKVDEPEAHSKGGIAIPETARDRQKRQTFRGVVVAVGPGKPVGVQSRGGGMDVVLHHPGVKVGDYVHFADYHGGEIEVEGQKFTVIDEDDILAVVPKGA